MRVRTVFRAASLLIAIVGIGCGSVSSIGDSGAPDGGGAGTGGGGGSTGSAGTTGGGGTTGAAGEPVDAGADTTTNNTDGSTTDTAPAKRTLTVAATGNGTGTIASAAGISCGTDCTQVVDSGTSVTLTASPTSGSLFVGWTGGGCTGTGPCTVVVTADVTVQASFALSNSVVVALAGDGKGSVTSSPAGIACPGDCSEAYGPAQTVTLSATPMAGSTFTGWSGGSCTGTGTCVVSTNAAVAVSATFTLITFPLTVTKAGNGTGTVTGDKGGLSCGATCSANFVPGTMVTLSAMPGAGTMFGGWTGGGCTGTGACTVNVAAATSVQATFTLAQYAITVTKAGTGTGTVTSNIGGLSCGATCAAPFNFGQSVTLTAAPAVGSTFAGWSGGGCTGTGTCTVGVSAATVVTATFTLNSYAVSVAKAGTGSGTVTSAPAGISCGATCSAVYNHGTAVTLTATPAVGSNFTGWSGGGCAGTGTCVVSVTAATSVTATFAVQQFTLSVAKNGGSTGTVTGTGISCGATCSNVYNYGASVTLTATPSSGAVFAGWSGACVGTGTCTVSMVVARSVTATFNPAFQCTNQTGVSSCTNAVISEINMGAVSAAACYSGCTTALANAGVATGCWVLAINGNCYCRGGVLNLGGSSPGGSCSQ